MRRFQVQLGRRWGHKFAGLSSWVETGNCASPVLVPRNQCLCSTAGDEQKIVAAVVLERLPVVLPPLHADVASFRKFSFEWQQQHRRHYPQELLDASSSRSESGEVAAFVPGGTITEADETGDRRSLQRALKQRLYLILYGIPFSATEEKPKWHFPEKLYSNEPSLRQCAEGALGSLIGDPSNSVYFVGNAPCGHLPYEMPAFTRFFFRSQLLVSELNLEQGNYSDFAWISKQEVPLHFDEDETKFLQDLLH